MKKIFSRISQLFGGATTPEKTSTTNEGAKQSSKPIPFQRSYAETELVLARRGKLGYFKIDYTTGERVVFEIWGSKKHTDRWGLPYRRIFIRSYRDQDGNIEHYRHKQGVLDPYLPINVIYGMDFDANRLPDEHRNNLLFFADEIRRGLEEYNERRMERFARRAA